METKGFLGIDVSKGYADFLLLGVDKSVIEEGFQLQDNAPGRKQLKELICSWFNSGMEILYSAVESTGGYESNWYDLLKNLSRELNLKVARLNPKGVKAVSDASLKRTITDAVSAENIAVYLMSFPEKVDYGANDFDLETSEFKAGRQYYCYIRMIQKQKVQLSNQLEKLLYQYYSEMLVYCRNGIPNWLLRMFTHYSSAASIMKAGEKKLAAIKGISKEKAQAIIKKSSSSTQQISKQIEHVIVATSREILHKDELIKSEKDEICLQFQDNAQVQLLTTIPGIGTHSAVAAMLEIENISRFISAKKLAAYFGVHPTYKQSGDGQWAAHMSKKGRGELRGVLYMAALSGIRCNPILKTLYARFRAKGMKHYQAMGIIMHKLLRIIYGVLKNKTPFDVAIDEKNISSAKIKQEENKINLKATEQVKTIKKRRYQLVTSDAPLSRIAAKKERKQTASQTSD